MMLGGLYLASLYSYLLFHVLAELFSVIIGFSIFMMAWNARRVMNNNYLLVLGTAFLSVAVLDLAHTLCYKGMSILPLHGANQATQLWVAARFTQGFSLLLAAILFHRRLKPGVLLAAYAILSLALLISIFVWPVFPVCYVEGTGLTPFKRFSEYAICLLLAAGGGALLSRRAAFDPQVLRALLWSIALTVASELVFTRYLSVYGPSNLVGHFFKIVAFYLVYKAIIQTGLSKPYALLLREARQNEERYRLLFDRSPDGVFAVDTAGRFLIANPACETISGYSLDELLQKTFLQLCAPDRLAATREHFLNSLSKQQYPPLETALTRKDGARVELWVAGEPILSEGKIAGVHCTARNITGRKQAEEALRASETRLRLALEGASAGVWEWNIPTGALVWSRENYDLYGLDPAEGPPAYATWHQSVYPADAPAVTQALEDTVEGRHPEYHAEFRVLHPAKGLRWIMGLGRVERGPDGKALRMVGINMDITQRKAFEAELERLVTERTARLEEMIRELQHVSYSIVHDMRAPLRAMQGFAGLMEEACAGCQRGQPREYYRRICAATKRIDMQITDAVQYTKAVLQDVRLGPVDLGQLLSELLESYPNLHPDRADIRIEAPLPVVLGNESLLTQCFSNLLENAVKFVAPGQRAQVRVWAEPMTESEANPKSNATAPSVRIWVSDNGIGIAKEGQALLFHMFYRGTTDYEGTGIGLAIVRKVVERMGGNVGVESEAGQGSRFWVELRLADATANVGICEG